MIINWISEEFRAILFVNESNIGFPLLRIRVDGTMYNNAREIIPQSSPRPHSEL